MLRKLFGTIKASTNLVKAFDLASRERFQESLDVLKKIESTLNGKDEEFHILKSFLLLKVGSPEETIENAKAAFSLIAKNRKLNNDERLYLKIFLSKVCEEAYNILGESEKVKNVRQAYVDEKVDLLNIDIALKRNFPLTIREKE